MTIGERIKDKRIELGLSQEDLAKRLGYSTRNAVYQLEQKDNLKLSVVSKIAKALGCSESYLMGWEEKQNLNNDTAILLARLTKSYMIRNYVEKLMALSEKDQQTVFGLIDVLSNATHSEVQE